MSLRTILTTAAGFGIDLRNPRQSDYADATGWLGEHLAKEKRYNGATPGVEYSVAQHVRHAADAAAQALARGEVDNELSLLPAYLMKHDDEEGVTKDLTTPLKNTIAEEIEAHCGVLAPKVLEIFDSITERHNRMIHAAAGLVWPPSPAMREAIKHFDKVMFVTEWRDFMPGCNHPDWKPYEGIAPLPDVLVPMPWREAHEFYAAGCRLYLPVYVGTPPHVRDAVDREVGRLTRPIVPGATTRLPINGAGA